MSKKVKEAAPEAAQQKKVQTKYDRKMQKRKEEEERLKKEQRRSKIIGFVVVALLAAFILSFPIRSYLAINSAYVTVNGEKITQVEFDYNYAIARTTYLNNNSSWLSMFGLDVSTIDSEMYSADLTYEEYFEKLAVDNIISTKSMRDVAKAEGFTYDAEAEYETWLADLEAEAEAAGLSLKDYVKACYGSLATPERIKEYVEETMYVAAFYTEKANEKMATTEEITAYYNENKASYDSIDYHMSIVEAQLPTTNPDGTVPTDEEGNEVEYEPTEEEIATAMAEAKEKAEAARETVAEEGEGYTNVSVQNSYINSLVTDFLFDESTKVGDTYVAEDTTNNRYLVVSFDGRYLDETPTADARVIISTTLDSQTILDEWKAGEATEDSFIELVAKYDENGGAEYDGLYEGLSVKSLSEEMHEWLSSTERVAGDTFAINIDGDANYVLYYVKENDPSWMIDIRDSLLSATMNEYLTEVAEGYAVEDPKGKLEYLKVEAVNAEAADTVESDTTESDAAEEDAE